MAKYLIKTTEEHRADNESEAAELINNAKADGRYILSKYSSVKKERKQKGEIVDEYYIVTLVKVFDDAKEPCGEATVEYRMGAF
jgi:hypothetical protein